MNINRPEQNNLIEKISNYAFPVISVLMPVYNAGKYVELAVNSIINQSITNFESVIIDDGSTDNSKKILQKYADQDSRIRWFINLKKLGIVKTLNLGLVQCKGKYIARMDADDISIKDRLQIQFEFVENCPDIGTLGIGLSYIDSGEKALQAIRVRDIDHSLLSENPLFHPTMMCRNSIIHSNHIFYREEFQYAEDYYFWLDINKCSKLAAIDEVCLSYRITPEVSRRKLLQGMIKATSLGKWQGVLKLKLTPTFNDFLLLLGNILINYSRKCNLGYL